MNYEIWTILKLFTILIINNLFIICGWMVEDDDEDDEIAYFAVRTVRWETRSLV